MERTKPQARTPLPWAGLALYSGLVLLSTVALVIADWTSHLALVPIVGMLGVLAGALLAHSMFQWTTAGVMGAVYGAFFSSWLMAQTLDASLIWREKLLAVWSRFGVFLSVVARGEPNYDTLMVVFLWCLGYWAMAVFGAWSFFRRRGLWGVVVPLGAALFLNALYYEGPGRLDLVLAVYLLLSVLVFMFQEIRQRQSSWEAIRARVPAQTTAYVVRVSALCALGLVLLAWAAPALAQSERAATIWSTISGPWRSTRDRLDDVMSGLGSPAVLIVDEFGSQLQLDAGTDPVDVLVMEVQPETQVEGPGRFYWRARTYDTYQAGGWSSAAGEQVSFDPATPEFELPEHRSRETVEVAFAVNNAVQSLLYVPSQPLWVDRSANLQIERDEGEMVAVNAVLSELPVQRDEVYRARAAVAVPNARQLRSAGDAYPQWVRERYLQLPETVTARTRDLAVGIAGNLPTAYDKAEAITAWLRTNIQYQRVTEAPPSDDEPLDWFLFEYRTGFCNYYATAEVVMLRSLGIPARLAVGYARGDYDAERGVYEVWAEDYHAWPEVYFPEYGWVEFEPTVSQPPLIRPAPRTGEDAAGADVGSGVGSRGEAEALRLARLEDPFGTNEAAADTTAGLGGDRRTGLALATLGIVGALGLLWTWMDVAWRDRIAISLAWLARRTGIRSLETPVRWAAVSSPISTAYQRWVRWLPRLGVPVEPHQTPHERAAAFARAHPDLADPAWDLVGAYTQQRFSGVVSGRYDARRAWPGLLRGLLAAWGWSLGSRLLGWMQEGQGAGRAAGSKKHRAPS